MSSGEAPPLLELRGLTVEVRGETHLRSLTLRIGRGEIHAVVGDEGEKRSSLLKVLAGEISATAGVILLEGRSLAKHTPRRALQLGIEIIDKPRKGFGNLSVLQNIFAERAVKTSLGMPDWRRMQRTAEELFETLQLPVDLSLRLGSLSPDRQRVVEIARALCAQPKLLLVDESVIDEIRASVTAQIVERLYYVFAVLAKGGTTILFNAYRLEQVMSIADRVSIIADGSLQRTTRPSDIDKMQLIQLTYTSLRSRKDLEKSNFELFYTKQVYEGIINGLALPLVVTDTKRNVTVINEAAERMLGVKRDAVFCEPVHKLLRLEEAEVAAVEEELHTKSKKEFHFHRAPRADADLFVFPVMDEVESSMGMLFLLSRKGGEFDYERQIKANAERFNSEYRIAKIVHEVKNPLGIMLNNLRLIRSEQSIENVKENTLSIEKEVERICRLLEHLKRTEDPSRAARVSAMTSEIVRAIAELLHPLVEKRGIRLRIECLSDCPMPHDPDLLRQVLLNIALNGIEAMEEGGELLISSGTTVLKQKNMIVIEVTDSGKGIPVEDLERVFEPFYTTKSDHGSGGMGLAISREIVHGLDGTIVVESAPGKGSTFKVLLPAKGKRNSVVPACF